MRFVGVKESSIRQVRRGDQGDLVCGDEQEGQKKNSGGGFVAFPLRLVEVCALRRIWII